MNDPRHAVALVRDFLEATMLPDPEKAARCVAADLRITFTGARKFTSPAQISEFNRKRYRSVKKRFDRFDVCESDDGTVVYSLGSLYGEWPDGQPFEGNRYVDRFLIRDGKIVSIEVWNDSAEMLLEATA